MVLFFVFVLYHFLFCCIILRSVVTIPPRYDTIPFIIMSPGLFVVFSPFNCIIPCHMLGSLDFAFYF